MSAKDPEKPGRQPGPKPDRRAERAARLEEELRANLRRRKEQARLRAAADVDQSGGQPEAPPPRSKD